MPRIVPYNRSLRFDDPPFSARRSALRPYSCGRAATKPCAASATPLHRLHPLFHLATVL